MIKPALLVVTCILVAGCSNTPEVFTETTPSGINNCLTTGTHIVSRQRGCSYAAGRSYSRADVEATGATTAGALVALDPAITSR
jgi:hypothetical protein